MPPSTRDQFYFWRSDISVVLVYREYSCHNSYSMALCIITNKHSPRFWDGIRRQKKTCPIFLQGYSSVGEHLPRVLKRIFVRWHYLPHVLERVFVQWTNTCPMCWRGYSSVDGYLLLVLERVFVHQTNDLPHVLPHKQNTKPTNTNTYSYSYSCGVCSIVDPLAALLPVLRFFPLFFPPHPIYYLRSSPFFFSLPRSRNSDPGSHNRLFSPPPHYGSCLAILSREDFSSSFVDSRRIVSTATTINRRQQIFFSFFFCK